MFSIIVPSYNRNSEVLQLLDSLTRQTFQNFEVVIIDDCSKISVKVEKKYPFSVKLVRNQINQGASISRNIGVQQASYDWVLFLDDDDRFHSKKCEIISDVINKNQMINFIYHSAFCHMVYQNFTYKTSPEKIVANICLEKMLLVNQIGGMPMIVIKKQLFIAVGGLSKEIKALEDYEFLLKLVISGRLNAYYIDEPLTDCFFYTQRNSVSKNIPNTYSAIKYIYHKYGVYYPINFKINANNMLAYAHLMNLSSKAVENYWDNFLLTKNIKYIIQLIVCYISPNLLINLRKYI